MVEKMGQSGRIRSFQSLDRLVQIVVGMLSESGAEVRNSAKICVYKLQTAIGGQRELL